MSGTSFDGVDVSLIKTDGYNYSHEIHSSFVKYSSYERKLYNFSLFKNLKKVQTIIDEKHILCIRKILNETKFNINNIDIIGLHGQTIAHNPAEKWTWQYINAVKISNKFNSKVISELRLKDLNYGGEGAPLVPIYHSLLCKGFKESFPIIVVNIGGVANATILHKKDKFSGFDIGPGNGPLDSIVFKNLGKTMDKDGEIAKGGSVNDSIVNKTIDNLINRLKTKSFDRNEIDNICLKEVKMLNLSDALATLTQIICQMIVLKIKIFNPRLIVLVGGGRKNKFLVKSLKDKFDCSCLLAEDVGWNGDSIEAQAFAYLAVRSLLGLNITYKETTGVNRAISGGVLYNIN